MFKLILLHFVCGPCFALDFFVYGPCNDTPLFEQEVEVIGQQTVGEITTAIFNSHQVPYEGDNSYMLSIFNSPKGLDAIEILSDTAMRSHGWIFSINGKVSDSYPNEVTVSNGDQIIWFYGYATYDNGKWSTEYQYSNNIKPEKFCR